MNVLEKEGKVAITRSEAGVNEAVEEVMRVISGANGSQLVAAKPECGSVEENHQVNHEYFIDEVNKSISLLAD